MNITNFYPLLIWSLGFLAVVTYEQTTYIKSNVLRDNKTIKDSARAEAVIFCWGCIFWAVLGAICNIK